MAEWGSACGGSVDDSRTYVSNIFNMAVLRKSTVPVILSLSIMPGLSTLMATDAHDADAMRAQVVSVLSIMQPLTKSF